jgi:hypothetical protein
MSYVRIMQHLALTQFAITSHTFLGMRERKLKKS